MNKFKAVNKTIAETLVGTQKEIEKKVVGTHNKIADGVVGSYTHIEDKFIDTFLKNEDESTDEARHRLRSQNEIRKHELDFKHSQAVERAKAHHQPK